MPAPSTAGISLAVGLACRHPGDRHRLAIGLAGRLLPQLDNVLMRFMDGLMAIPGILLAIALVSLNKASVGIVDRRHRRPRNPRVVRLVRSVVLTTASSPSSRRRSAAHRGLKISCAHRAEHRRAADRAG